MVIAVILVAIILGLLYWRATSHYTFWEKHGVKCPIQPTLKDVFKATFSFSRKWANYAPDEPYIGLINLRSLGLSVRGPDLIRLILSKDFTHFHDRGLLFSEKRNPLAANLFNLEGHRWKILRAKLTPTFTSGRLRGMFPHMKYCADQLISVLPCTDKPESLDIANFYARFTTDVILSCAFGLQGNSLKDSNDIYLKMVKLNFTNDPIRQNLLFLFRVFPALESWLPLPATRRKVTDFFLSSFKSTVQAREQSGEKRNDFLDLLLEIKKNGRLSDGHADDDALDTSVEFTDRLMVAQAFVFFVAGSETSSGTSSFATVELANNIAIQDKVRTEIDDVLQRHGGLTYEAIMDMTYLDQVVSETLRKYPPAETIIRTVTKPYPLPDGKAILPVGTRISIPALHIQNNPHFYPDPHRFDPERFSPEAKQARSKFVYLPFGEGPRSCIGMRFGLVQVKVALATVISQFEIRPNPGTPYPPKLATNSIVLSLAEGGGQVILTRRHTPSKL